jgi:hypothetical protein
MLRTALGFMKAGITPVSLLGNAVVKVKLFAVELLRSGCRGREMPAEIKACTRIGCSSSDESVERACVSSSFGPRQ